MRIDINRHRGRLAIAAALLGLLALAGACGGGTTDSTEAEAARDAEGVAAPVTGSVENGLATDGTAREAGRQSTGLDRTANRPTVQTRAVIRRGEIALVTKEMNRARTEIEDILARHGGYLASEDTENDRTGRPEWSVLVIRVPEPAFDTAMSELGDIGRTQRADRSSEDVTTEVIDIDTRVATQEASLGRLQRFLRQATNVDDMIRLESEIATRQADLESLKAQQKYLADQTSMSTITVRLRTPAAPPPSPAEDEGGFLDGLADGWAALTTVLVGAATLAGVLLPFVVAAALVGVPTWLLLRATRRRRRAHVPVAPEPS